MTGNAYRFYFSHTLIMDNSLKEQYVTVYRSLFIELQCMRNAFLASLTRVEAIRFHVVSIRIRYCLKEV